MGFYGTLNAIQLYLLRLGETSFGSPISGFDAEMEPGKACTFYPPFCFRRRRFLVYRLTRGLSIIRHRNRTPGNCGSKRAVLLVLSNRICAPNSDHTSTRHRLVLKDIWLERGHQHVVPEERWSAPSSLTFVDGLATFRHLRFLWL